MRLAVAALLLLAGTARADDKHESCYDELEARHIGFKKTKKPGIAKAVEISGTLGGVEVSGEEPLVIDCSLAVSLDEVGRYMRALGIDKATFASAYSRRNVRGTNHPSKHSYGLAIDISGFSGPDLGTMRVARDYEQGLGDAVDCVGTPMTQAGAVLKILQCQLVRSGLFHFVLSPDYDDAHHDHFHLEVKSWGERPSLRASTPAIH
ncbi:MAG TPA: extensin family protein [Kofleriaceae bacterium]